jgi:hypothetical protein
VIYAVEMPSRSIISLSSFMKIGAGVKAILRFCVNNLKAVMLVLLKERNYEVYR